MYPPFNKEEIVVENVNTGVIISAPAGIFNDSIAKSIADEPELVIRPYFLSNSLAILDSNSFTFFPI